LANVDELLLPYSRKAAAGVLPDGDTAVGTKRHLDSDVIYGDGDWLDCHLAIQDWRLENAKGLIRNSNSDSQQQFGIAILIRNSKPDQQSRSNVQSVA
jgi:hypothetical protein